MSAAITLDKKLLDSAVIGLDGEREWNWGSRPYNLKYRDSHKALLVAPMPGNVVGSMRFTTDESHLLDGRKSATIYSPPQMVDEIERGFLMLSILQTEGHRQDELFICTF
ncbi:hypothetical protein B0H19DRAFT_1274014 [Mycena capillaripes]|nr:hypothetical protein B0H19DRAFT_1274014 [Mycena capillaripes]